jgi:hypothetical protein
MLVDRPLFDRLETIQTLIGTLDGMKQLADERRKYAWARQKEGNYRPLHAWVIYGTWYADETGGFSRGEFMDYATGREAIGALMKVLPDVIEMKDIQKVIPKFTVSYSPHSHLWIPGNEDRCPECGGKFNVKQAHETHPIKANYEAPVTGYLHGQCHKFRAAVESRDYYSEIIRNAGVKSFVLDEIPNGYGPNEDWPWYRVRLWAGSFKIGWRKRVINIDWGDLAFINEEKIDKAKDFFRKEGVTTDDHLVHAYGKEKCTDYVARILACLEAS